MFRYARLLKRTSAPVCGFASKTSSATLLAATSEIVDHRAIGRILAVVLRAAEESHKFVIVPTDGSSGMVEPCRCRFAGVNCLAQRVMLSRIQKERPCVAITRYRCESRDHAPSDRQI